MPVVAWIALAAALVAALPAPAQPSAPDLPRPTAAQAAWQDRELGLFIHYDLQVFKPGWDHRQYATRPEPTIFNPTRLNTDQWIQAAKAMGAGYAVLTAKHGSGFMLWQSDLYPFGMKQSPYLAGKGDIVRDFIASCRRAGIGPGVYAHMGCNGYLEVDNPGLVNRGQGGDPEKQARYARICEGMLGELWGRYGPLFEIWFDGGVLDPERGGPDMLPILKRTQPKATVFQGPAATIRWIGNEDGVAPYPCWATVPASRDYSGPGDPAGVRWLPGECDVAIRRNTWMWEPNTEDRLLSVEELMDRYERSVGRGCNLLLNANPGPDGLIPEADMKRYAEFGAEIRRRYGACLAETRGRGAQLTLTLPAPRPVNALILQEQISRGERIRRYVVEARVEGAWRQVCAGESVGHKRIQRFEAVTADALRLRVLESQAQPQIRRLAVFMVEPVDR